MNPADFEFYKRFLRDKAGFQLNQDKVYLLESRLTPIAKKWNYHGTADLIPHIRLGQNAALIQDVIDAMTTNETLFFRDDKPFKHLKGVVLPALIEKRKMLRKIRIWSAACSTGQEPYSIGMILREIMPDIATWKIEILATDLSQTVLEQARSGRYSQFEIQ
ncbi:MAG TPA: CheR family methyltransferase, partial [Phototrophicaceae bacterium]|nr:CheR family methyltransferase [Phototrophicaceae bacterium]